jgi:hypothetical protein
MCSDSPQGPLSSMSSGSSLSSMSLSSVLKVPFCPLGRFGHLGPFVPYVPCPFVPSSLTPYQTILLRRSLDTALASYYAIDAQLEQIFWLS